jgi:hypothetical protein
MVLCKVSMNVSQVNLLNSVAKDHTPYAWATSHLLVYCILVARYLVSV